MTSPRNNDSLLTDLSTESDKKPEKRSICDRMVILFLAANVVSQSSYILIAPFVPPILDKKGISTETVGLIFGAYPVAVILTSPFIGNYIE